MSGLSTPSREIVEHDHARAAAQSAERLLVQFGPDLRAGLEDQQPDGLAAVAERQHEQPGAPVLAGVRIAHHGAGAVIDLGFLARRGVDDRAGFRIAAAAQLADVALDALVSAGEAAGRPPSPARSPWRCGPWRATARSVRGTVGRRLPRDSATADGGPESVVTSIVSLAGFADASRWSPRHWPVLPAARVGGHLFGRFCRRRRPHRPGGRTATPAAFRYPAAVSRRTPVSFSMRRKGQPSRPSAITCCLFLFAQDIAHVDGGYRSA